MSTEFNVDLEDISSWNQESLPIELIATAGGGRLQIGTCYCNGNRATTLRRLAQDGYKNCSIPHFFNRGFPSIGELCSSKKPYFSKWSGDSPIEFFNTKLRFSWYIPVGLQESDDGEDDPEDFQKAMFGFWDSILGEMTPIHHGSTHPIDNWKDLSGTIFGDNRYMESSRFTQGTFSQFLSD